METEYDVIRYEKRDKVAFITINRPEKMNALSAEAVSQLRSA